MSSIAVNIIVLLIKGIPEGMLAVLALHLFTRTKLHPKKYLFLSFIYIAATYLIRFLPIALGVNTVLSLFVLIISFQLTYKTQLSQMIRAIVSSAVVLITIAISEVINMLGLIAIYGQSKAESMFTSQDGLIKSISTTPTNLIFALFMLIGYLILKKIDKRKLDNGETGTKTGT